ncbi:unnamed protein product, partial [Oppiella nova]
VDQKKESRSGGGHQRNHRTPSSSHRSASNISGNVSSPQRPPDFPLRILVLSDMVGAIIGRSGGTIRQITQQTRARVDVHRKDNAGALEKVITIYGNPENCSEACLKILEVMQTEANNTNRGEIPLKILAHNNLIGRIIGKSGNTIKRIMEQTDTKITVSSSIHDANSFNLERIITIKGSLENICRAESMISQRLRQSYESDLQVIAPQAVMFPGLHPMAMMSTLGPQPNYPLAGPSGRGGAGGPNAHPFGIYNTSAYGVPPLLYSPAGGGPGSGLHPSAAATLTAGFQAIQGGDQTKETVFLYIPNSAVGAIIGTGGTTIRDMISSSGANIKVAQPSKEESAALAASGERTPHERRVTIVGNPESQWKAQFMIYRKVSVEGFVASSPDALSQEPRLKVEIMIPSSQVGRIIGKGGQVVRDMQRNTRATIKLPEESSGGGGDGLPPEETPVHIIGDFLSTQAAQRQIRALVSRTTVPSTVGKPTKSSRDSGGSRAQQPAPTATTPQPRTSPTPAANHHHQQPSSPVGEASESPAPPTDESKPRESSESPPLPPESQSPELQQQ